MPSGSIVSSGGGRAVRQSDRVEYLEQEARAPAKDSGASRGSPRSVLHGLVARLSHLPRAKRIAT